MTPIGFFQKTLFIIQLFDLKTIKLLKIMEKSKILRQEAETRNKECSLCPRSISGAEVRHYSALNQNLYVCTVHIGGRAILKK